MSTSTVTLGRAQRTPSLLAVLLSVWLGVSTFLLHGPLNGQGQDAALRDRGLTLLLLLLSVCWARATAHRRAFLVAFAVVALLLVVESYPLGYTATGAMARVWWNEKITGVLMLACAVAGWSRAPAVEQDLRPR